MYDSSELIQEVFEEPVPNRGNTPVNYVMTEVAGRDVREMNIPGVFDRIPMDRLYEALPDEVKERIQETLKENLGRIQRRVAHIGQREIPSFEEICLTFLIEVNAEVIRRIAEE